LKRIRYLLLNQEADVRRREFLKGLAGTATGAWPLAVSAQQPAIPVIGYLSSASPGQDAGRLGGFRQGLRESGYIEGRNVVIEYRWAEEQYDRLPAMAADLVRRPASVIVQAGQISGALAAKALTKTIPIVFLTGGDPVALGLVDSLNRPGGNVTGVVSLSTELEPKKLELLHGVIPASKIVGALINDTNPFAQSQSSRLQQAGHALGLTVQIVTARIEDDFEAIFAKLTEQRVGGLVIANDGLFNSKPERLAALATRYALPTIFQFRAFAAAGGLMSYGGDLVDLYRVSGTYTGRILKGEKPSDLPVQQSTKVELMVNLKTARAFGLTIPISLLGRADEVIE
jgi:putative tryptophan/tyrosine transport system substrate-binding protein